MASAFKGLRSIPFIGGDEFQLSCQKVVVNIWNGPLEEHGGRGRAEPWRKDPKTALVVS
jgi:hypothetical protein